MKRVHEVISLCLDEEKSPPAALELVGIQQVYVWQKGVYSFCQRMNGTAKAVR